jgi:large subunit ribosomal protein L18
MALTKSERKKRIQKRIRKKIAGTTARPRLSVYRSNIEIYAQVIDDKTGKTIVAAGSRDKDLKGDKANKSTISKKVGAAIAAKAKAAGIEAVVFDRGGYLYHGRVKALAEGAREGGLKF